MAHTEQELLIISIEYLLLTLYALIPRVTVRLDKHAKRILVYVMLQYAAYRLAVYRNRKSVFIQICNIAVYILYKTVTHNIISAPII